MHLGDLMHIIIFIVIDKNPEIDFLLDSSRITPQ